MKTLAKMVSMQLGAWSFGALRLLPLAVALLAVLPGCLNDEARSELKCDANGCLVCERYTCYEYTCATDFQCPDGYGCNAAGQCKPSAASPGGGGTNSGGAQCGAQVCPTGTSCEFGACVTPDVGGTATECTLTAQCEGGQLCIDGACVDKPVVDGGDDRLPPWICSALSAFAQAMRAASSFAMPASRSQRRPWSFSRAAN